MSEPRDHDWERCLEEHADIRDAYRTRSAEAPPAALDTRILAAAHRAAGSRPRPAGFGLFRRLRAPVAAAAIVLLSASLVFTLRERESMPFDTRLRQETAEPQPPASAARPFDLTDEKDEPARAGRLEHPAGEVPSSLRSKAQGSAEAGHRAKLDQPAASPSARESPAATGVSPAASMSPALEVGAGKREPPATAERRFENAESGVSPAPALDDPSRPASQAASVPAAPPSPPSAEQPRAPQAFPARIERDDVAERPRSSDPLPSGERKKDWENAPESMKTDEAEGAATLSSDVVSVGGAQPASAPAEAEAGKSAAEAQAFRPPAEWLDEIRRLLRENRLEEARRELERFRKSYPSYLLPADVEYLLRQQ